MKINYRRHNDLFLDTVWYENAILPNLKENEEFSYNGTFCIDWRGWQQHGYGKIKYQYKDFFVHRVVWMMNKGTIPEKLEPDHLCERKICSNLLHLEIITHSENMSRARITDKCKQGHEFTMENTYFSNGKRQCKTCTRIRAGFNFDKFNNKNGDKV